MDPRIAISHGWADDDITELNIEVCDGRSQFVNTVYVGRDWPENEATALATFSRQVHGGLYDLKAGETGPEFANGAFVARFHYHKPTALYISTFQQSGYFPFKSTQAAGEAKLFLRTEPGLLDEFVGELARMHGNKSPTAILRCIPLHGA